MWSLGLYLLAALCLSKRMRRNGGKGWTDTVRVCTQRELSNPAGVGIWNLLYYVGTLQKMFCDMLRTCFMALIWHCLA